MKAGAVSKTNMDTKTKTRTKTRTRTESVVAGIMGKGGDERSDIYSLGATLYHLITGYRPPEDFEAIRPIGDFDVKTGEGFQKIIEKMMELDPAKRHRNGRELLYALQHVYELDSTYKSIMEQIWS